MKYFFIKLSVLALALLVSFSGCNKDDDEDNNETPEYDTQTSQDNALAENTWNDLGTMADQAVTGSLSAYRPGSGVEISVLTCATVSSISLDSISGDSTITIDFGNSWTSGICADGRYRKGKVHVAWHGGTYRDSGVVIRTYADSLDFYCIKFITDLNHYIQVIGARTVTNQGLNGNNDPYFNVHVDGRMWDNVGRKMTWISDRVRTWTDGDTTASWTDDRYSISGNADGLSFDAVHFTVNISYPLVINLGCASGTCKITQGIIDLTPDGKPTRTLDFGSGACDNDAVVTVRGNSYPITIR
jgi:hypothetical protein